MFQSYKINEDNGEIVFFIQNNCKLNFVFFSLDLTISIINETQNLTYLLDYRFKTYPPTPELGNFYQIPPNDRVISINKNIKQGDKIKIIYKEKLETNKVGYIFLNFNYD